MSIPSQEETSTVGILFPIIRNMMHRRFHDLNENIAEASNLVELFREMYVAQEAACRLHGKVLLDTEVEPGTRRARLEQASGRVAQVEHHIHWLDYLQTNMLIKQ